MKIAMGAEGFVVNHVTRVGDIIEHGPDNPTAIGNTDPYSYFIVWTDGGTAHRVEGESKEEVEKRRQNLIIDINQYYAEPLDI